MVLCPLQVKALDPPEYHTEVDASCLGEDCAWFVDPNCAIYHIGIALAQRRLDG